MSIAQGPSIVVTDVQCIFGVAIIIYFNRSCLYTYIFFSLLQLLFSHKVINCVPVLCLFFVYMKQHQFGGNERQHQFGGNDPF